MGVQGRLPPAEELLKFKYWRSFEPTATPVNTFEVTVTVK